MSYRSTKTRFCLFVAGLLLWATPTVAQQLPFTLPANTVVGRTNIGPGEATAMPFAQLASQLAQFGLLTNPLTFAELLIRRPIPSRSAAQPAYTASGIVVGAVHGDD